MMDNPLGIWASAILASVIATVLAWQRGYLTTPAAVLAAAMGTVILACAGLGIAAAVAVCFFVTALLSQRRDRIQRNDVNHKQAKRNLGQVLANGLTLATIALASSIFERSILWDAALLGCLGAVAGDTWASEVAQFSRGQPRLATSFKPVPAGTPGAVTLLGLLLTAAAGVVGALTYLLANESTIGSHSSLPVSNQLILVMAAGVGGLVGGLVDSILGASIQGVYELSDGQITDHRERVTHENDHYLRGWCWLTNNLVNFLNSITGAVTTLLIAAFFL